MTEQQWLASTDPDAMLACLRERGLIDGNTPWRMQPKMKALDAALQERGWVGAAGIIEESERASMFIDPYRIACHFIRDIFGNPFRKILGPQYDPTSADHRGVENYVVFQRWLSWNDGTVPKLARAIAGGETCERCDGAKVMSGYHGEPAPPGFHDDIPCHHCHGTGKTPPNFADMPILADALEDAGCQEQEILMHCRGKERCHDCCGTGDGIHKQSIPRPGMPNLVIRSKCHSCKGVGLIDLRGPHVAGCWVLSLILPDKQGAKTPY